MASSPLQKTSGGILKTKIARVREALLTDLVEREEPMRLVLLAALAGEHSLLIGPPGTAKSELARRLHHAFALDDGGGGYFERLLTRFTVPEELFGPLSIAELEKDVYRRKTERYLPTASIAFIDEIFKANSAILNSLLTILNERLFDNGSERHKIPLISVVGASNEYPKREEELAALYDRFLVRYAVGPVSAEGFERLVDLRGNALLSVSPADRISKDELKSIQQGAERVEVPAEVRAMLRSLRPLLGERGIRVSDRRWRKIVKLLQVSAYTDGRSSVSIWDCWLIQHCAWENPDDRKTILDWYESIIGTMSPTAPDELAKVTEVLENRLRKDATDLVHDRDGAGQFLYTDHEGKATTKKKGKIPNPKRDSYSREPETMDITYEPKMIPKRFMRHDVSGRAAQVESRIKELDDHLASLDKHIASLIEVLDRHLWVPATFSSTARARLEGARSSFLALRDRLVTVLNGTKALPPEPEHERA